MSKLSPMLSPHRPMLPAKHSRQQRRRAQAARFETLESRILMTASVTGFNPPGFAALAGCYDGSGNLWFGNVNDQTIDRIDRTTGQVDESIDVSYVGTLNDTTVIPTSLVYDPVNQHIYFIDLGYSQPDYVNDGDSGAIIEIDPNNPTATPIVHALPATNSYSESPTQLTVTGDGSVWFTAAGAFITVDHGSGPETGFVSAIGRLGLDGSMSFATFNDFDSNIDDAGAESISANGADSVWVGLRRLDAPDRLGQTHIGTATWDATDSQVQITGAYDVNIPSDPDATYGLLSDVVTAPDGSVWFTLSDSSDFSFTSIHPPDRIVHGVLEGGTLVQTNYDLPTSVANPGPLDVQGLTLDSAGNAWFVENEGNQVGFLNTTSGQFTQLDLPDSTTGPYAIVPSADGTQAWAVTGVTGTGDTLLEVTNAAGFSGSGSNITHQEQSSLGNNVVVAAFSAPTGSYTASINWGDGTTTTGTVVATSDGNYAVEASGKVYATQGVYSGLVTVTSGSSTAGTIGFTATISDTPLDVTGQTVAVVPIIRTAVVVAQFTDDIDSTASEFTATINWGDGHTSTGLVVRDPLDAGHYFILALHVYAKRGTFTVTTSVTTDEVDATILSSTTLTTIKVS